MGLIKRLRSSAVTINADVVLVTPPTEKERAAAAALERLRGYAVHDGDCLTGAWPPQCCSCGLAELLKELGDD